MLQYLCWETSAQGLIYCLVKRQYFASTEAYLVFLHFVNNSLELYWVLTILLFQRAFFLGILQYPVSSRYQQIQLWKVDYSYLRYHCDHRFLVFVFYPDFLESTKTSHRSIFVSFEYFWTCICSRVKPQS